MIIRRLGAIPLLLAASCAPVDGGVEIGLAPYSSGEESPLAYAGGYVKGYSPLAWGDTTLPLMTPSLTVLEGRILAMEGFLHPEPGASVSNLGAFRVEGMAAEVRRKGSATALRAVLDYGGGTELHLNRICPGIQIRTTASAVDLFARTEMLSEAWRVSGKPSRPPAYVAFSEQGTVRVLSAKGKIPLGKMDRPWLLAWWGGKVKYEYPVRPTGGEGRRKIWPIYPATSAVQVAQGMGEWPMLIVLEKRAESLQASEKSWTFRFPSQAGRVIVAPLHGRRWVKADEIAKWREALPREAVAQADAWTARLRSIPVDVRETMKLVAGVPTITGEFTCETIQDDWNTPTKKWAPLPPMFAVARAKGLSIKAAGERPICDWNWLGRLGPLTGVDGTSRLTYEIRIPQLADYLRGPPADRPTKQGSPRCRQLQDLLRGQIDKLLIAKRLAPHHWPFGEMGSGFYSPTYFFSPGEKLVTLCWALPFASPDQAGKLKERIRQVYRQYSPFQQHWWGAVKQRAGAAPERYPLDAQYRRWIGGTNYNLHNLYAGWLYASTVADRAELPAIWQDAKKYFARHFRRAKVEWDYTERLRFPVRLEWSRHREHLTHRNHPAAENRFESYNSRINGAIGYTRLARMAGDRAAEEEGTCWLARWLALRYAQIYFDQYLIDAGVHWPESLPPPMRNDRRRLQSTTLLRGNYTGPWLIWTYIWKQNTPASETHLGDRIYRMHINHPVWVGSAYGAGVSSGREAVVRTSAAFLGFDLTPEVGAFYRDYAREFAEMACRKTEIFAPTWFMADGPTYWSSEEVVAPPEISWAVYLVHALVLNRNGDALHRYVDFPQAKVGDLYHLQKLAMALRAYNRSPQRDRPPSQKGGPR